MTTPTGPFTRAAPLRASSFNADERTFDLILSSGSAFERRDRFGTYSEVLDIAGATWPDVIPLLADHRQDLDNNLGDITAIRTEGGQIVGTARLSKYSEKAKRIAAELADGRSFSASVGYAVNAWSETKPAGKRTLTAKSWLIQEASLVSLPADPSAKIRSIDTLTTPTEPTVVTRAETNTQIRALAKTLGLDQAFIDTQIDAEADIATVNAAAIAALSARSAATGTVRTVTPGHDNNDPVTIRAAMSDALAHRIAPSAVKLEGRATEFRSYRVVDMIGDLAAARGERINLRDTEALMQRAVGAHSSSDFVALVSDSANKALLAQYAIAAPTYRKWAAKKTFVDFKEHNFLRVGDFPSFKPVAENGSFKYGTTSENREKVKAKEYGTGIAVGRQLLLNDDLSALSDFSGMIATRAAADENKLAYGVLAANANLADGKTLWHADHFNLAASGTAIDAAAITAAVTAIRGQKSLDGLTLNLSPAFLVVGPAKEVQARQLLASVNATKSSDVNVWANFAELIVDSEITDNRWYVFAAPSAAPVVVYGYVAGAEGPQIRSEIDFDTRAVKVAVSLDFAVGAIGAVGAYKNPGA